MFKHVINAKYIKDYTIWLAFNDGAEGKVDLSEKLKNRKGVFEPLRKIDYFRNFKIEGDTLSWANGADLAPDSLYDLLQEQN
jgi:hypothetical protein